MNYNKTNFPLNLNCDGKVFSVMGPCERETADIGFFVVIVGWWMPLTWWKRLHMSPTQPAAIQNSFLFQ